MRHIFVFSLGILLGVLPEMALRQSIVMPLQMHDALFLIPFGGRTHLRGNQCYAFTAQDSKIPIALPDRLLAKVFKIFLFFKNRKMAAFWCLTVRSK